MFLCRLALGSHTRVNPGYQGKEPPMRDDDPMLGVGVLTHDCTTDGNVREPGGLPQVMVAYKDQQAMAEYLVTFRWK